MIGRSFGIPETGFSTICWILKLDGEDLVRSRQTVPWEASTGELLVSYNFGVLWESGFDVGMHIRVNDWVRFNVMQ